MGKTNLSVSIETSGDLVRRYNEKVCNILADPQVLAYILINTMKEFTDWSISDMIDAIGDISVRKQLVNPGYSNLGRVVGEQTVDLVPGEGEVRYDIRFTVHYGDAPVRVLLNLEAQQMTKTRVLQYHIENRIQYYLARMISAQKNTEFVNDNYDDIKKVVSIWICMDAKKDCEGITRYSFASDILFGKDVIYDEFDKMEAYIIRIRKGRTVGESKNKLINMLETLFSTKKAEEVKKLLSEKHGMLMDIPDTEREVAEMCNFGEALFEEGLEEGLEKGLEKGIAEGMEKGVENILVAQITSKLKKGMNITDIADMLEQDKEYISELIEKYKLM